MKGNLDGSSYGQTYQKLMNASREIKSSVLLASSDTNQAVQPQRTVTGLNGLRKKRDSTIIVKTTALVSWAVTDLRLYFPICQKQVFSNHGSNKTQVCT